MPDRPAGPAPAPPVQRLRVRYAKRGRLRFSSHRDFQRALERAVQRARIPVATSAGFSPHPRISYLGAASTGAASEAEYLEIALRERVAPADVHTALDRSLPSGLDVVEVVESTGGSLAERIDASCWRVRLGGVAPETARRAVEAFLAAGEVPVERRTKDGRRRLDARAPVVGAVVWEDAGPPEPEPSDGGAEGPPAGPDVPAGASPGRRAGADAGRPCAILDLVVRHVTPAVRPDDVLTGLRQVAALVPPEPPAVTRLAQGLLDPSTGRLADPLAPDRPQPPASAAPAADGTPPRESTVASVAGALPPR